MYTHIIFHKRDSRPDYRNDRGYKKKEGAILSLPNLAELTYGGVSGQFRMMSNAASIAHQYQQLLLGSLTSKDGNQINTEPISSHSGLHSSRTRFTDTCAAHLQPKPTLDIWRRQWLARCLGSSNKTPSDSMESAFRSRARGEGLQERP